MRIVIATPLYPPEIGGPATHTLFLERTLPTKGIKVAVVPWSRVKRFPKVVRHALYAWRLWRAARGAQALFAEDSVSVGVPAALAASLARIPLIIRVPGDHAWEQGRQRFGVTDSLDDFQNRRYGWRIEFLRRLARFSLSRAALVIVPSDYFRKIVGRWGVPPERLRVIYNGIEPETAIPPRDLPARPFAVSAGRLVPWKGFDTLIELAARMPAWSFVIAGDGPLRKRLETAARERGVTLRVRFIGSIPRAELLGWLEAADAFVLNSSFESFSYQVVEAMGAGTPVIATAIGSIPELVHDKTHGALVKPDDLAGLESALESVLTDAAGWRERSEAAKQKARAFSAEATGEALASSLRAVVGSRARW